MSTAMMTMTGKLNEKGNEVLLDRPVPLPDDRSSPTGRDHHDRRRRTPTAWTSHAQHGDGQGRDADDDHLQARRVIPAACRSSSTAPRTSRRGTVVLGGQGWGRGRNGEERGEAGSGGGGQPPCAIHRRSDLGTGRGPVPGQFAPRTPRAAERASEGSWRSTATILLAIRRCPRSRPSARA